jgi:hypothetical protein
MTLRLSSDEATKVFLAALEETKRTKDRARRAEDRLATMVDLERRRELEADTAVVDEAVRRGVLREDERETFVRLFEASPKLASDHLARREAQERAYQEHAAMLGLGPKDIV